MSGDHDFMHELEIEVREELTMAGASHAEDVIDRPVEEWLFDPTDVEREEIELRDLLGAVETLEGGPHPDDPPAPGYPPP